MSLLNQNIRASPHAIKDHNQGLFSLSKNYSPKTYVMSFIMEQCNGPIQLEEF